MKLSNTLTSKERLKLTKKVDLLFSSGRWLRSEHLRLVYLLLEGDNATPCQVMFSAAKKQHRKAVKRNLLKRRMREVYRLNKHSFYSQIGQLDENLILGFIYSSEEIVDFRQIQKEMHKLLAQVVARIKKAPN